MEKKVFSTGKPMYYTLDENKKVVPTDDLLGWAAVIEDTALRNVGDDEINNVRISTKFLGLDHNWGEGDPLVFETMCFSENKDYDEYMERYSTWEEAERGHIFACNAVRAGIPLNNRKILKIKL